jgi:hypothetical protein
VRAGRYARIWNWFKVRFQHRCVASVERPTRTG